MSVFDGKIFFIFDGLRHNLANLQRILKEFSTYVPNDEKIYSKMAAFET